LIVQVVRENYAPPTVQPAVEVDARKAGMWTSPWGRDSPSWSVAGFRSEWRTDLLFGNTYGVQTELYRRSPPRAAGSSRHMRMPATRRFRFTPKNDPLADYRIYRINIGGDLGYSFGRFSELRVGYEVGFAEHQAAVGKHPQIPAVEGRVGQARLHYLLDHTDDPVIPRRGFSAETNFSMFDRSPGAKDGFPAMDLKLGYFQPIARLFPYFSRAKRHDFRHNEHGNPRQFFLGGPFASAPMARTNFRAISTICSGPAIFMTFLRCRRLPAKRFYAIGNL